MLTVNKKQSNVKNTDQKSYEVYCMIIWANEPQVSIWIVIDGEALIDDSRRIAIA